MSERVRNRERFKLSLAVFLLLFDEDKVLLLLRTDTGWLDGHYSVPGGVKEPSETLAEAITRETKEEIGVSVDPEDLMLAHIMHNFTTGEEWIGTFFLTQRWEGIPLINEPHKHGELAWFDLGNLPPNMSPYVRQAISHFLGNSLYSEFGWDVLNDAEDEEYLNPEKIKPPKKKDK